MNAWRIRLIDRNCRGSEMKTQHGIQETQETQETQKTHETHESHNVSGKREGSTYDRVIVPVNGFPPNDRAIGVAEVLAQQFDCDIEFSSMVYNGEHRRERSHLLHLLTLGTKRKSAFTNIEEGGDASPYILDLISRPESLVVLAGATSVLGMPGSITADVVRFAGQPVVIVGPQMIASWQGPITKLVVPLDGSTAAEHSLETALHWAQLLGAQIDLIQVLDPNDVTLARRLDPETFEASYLETVFENLRANSVPSVSFDVLHGSRSHRVDVICDYVRRQPKSLLCMATNGAHQSRSMLASTTLKVLHHSPVPVLIVRS
jgi:nucleotide-binding universal stress UspA family protein